jgi:hypothetical protein
LDKLISENFAKFCLLAAKSINAVLETLLRGLL